MAQPDIPAFGNWDTTGNTPYTQKFENARKNKKAGISSHPNDPRRHPEPPAKSPLHPAYTPDTEGQSPMNPQYGRRHEADPHRRHSLPQRELGGSASDSAPRSPYRMVPGSASPAQPNNPSKLKHRSAGIHTPERRAHSEGHGQHTPRRSRAKQGGRGYDAPENDVAVPPFGEWDEGNAASGEKFTGIFNRVRDDKLSPNTSTRQPDTNHSQENKVKQIFPDDICVDILIDKLKASREIISTTSLGWLIRQCQHHIIINTLRRSLVKYANNSRHSFEYIDKDGKILAHLAGGIDALIKISADWPLSSCGLKLISIHSSRAQSTDISVALLCKTKELANGLELQTRRHLVKFVDAVEDILFGEMRSLQLHSSSMS